MTLRSATRVPIDAAAASSSSSLPIDRQSKKQAERDGHWSWQQMHWHSGVKVSINVQMTWQVMSGDGESASALPWIISLRLDEPENKVTDWQALSDRPASATQRRDKDSWCFFRAFSAFFLCASSSDPNVHKRKKRKNHTKIRLMANQATLYPHRVASVPRYRHPLHIWRLAAGEDGNGKSSPKRSDKSRHYWSGYLITWSFDTLTIPSRHLLHTDGLVHWSSNAIHYKLRKLRRHTYIYIN